MVKELLQTAISETTFLHSGEVFLLKDLFKGYEWNRIPFKDRLLLGTLFLNSVRELPSIVILQKTSSNQQKYRKV